MTPVTLAQLRAERALVIDRAQILRRRIRGDVGELECQERRLAAIETEIRTLARQCGQQQQRIGEDHV